jgi:hypothetical protein
MRQVEVGMIRRLVERLKDKPAERPEELDCADCPDYDDCINPWICIATADDY